MAGRSLLGSGVDRQDEPDRRAVIVVADRDRAAERPHALLERLDRPPPALPGSVVANRELEHLRVAGLDPDRERLRRSAPDRALERLAHDLVERGLRPLAQYLSRGDVELGLNAVLEA